ncbi:hypothetical protein PRK78_006396 [Emydomyces testavorans]|uniref:Uncharacterized protein n=1 Tax=Emydomyces testavorans TaxID=2070801 RepID=A0AAF0DME5_9EURO|nr:hypothetical protein PRK78_006396 [Emydomyces testavorans]
MWKFFLAKLCCNLLVLAALAHGSPVGISARNGHLGSPPIGPQGSVLVASDDDSSNATAARPRAFLNVSRGVNTTLALVSTALITATYAVLIGPGTRLSSTSKIPLGCIRTNIGNLLSRAWPDMSTSSQIDGSAVSTTSHSEEDAIRLFYVGKLVGDEGRIARGVEECEALPKTRIPTPSMWLTSGSSLTKSMVQLAIWEWVCLWMVVAMLTSTLMFNGFFSNQRTPDAYPRLVIVIIYVTAFCLHAWYVRKTCVSFFTLFGAGATWSLLNKASFSSVDLGQLKAGIVGGTPPVFRKTGKPAASPVFPPYANCRLKGMGPLGSVDPTKDSPQKSDEDQGALDTVITWQKSEISSTVQAGSAALERVITNVMTIVGITITTGFAPWTSITSSGDSTIQLGSLGLLASLTIGSGAMFSSAVELSVMNSSFRNVLFYKEVMINGQATAHVQKRAKTKNVVGFTHNTVKMKRIGLLELTKFTKLWALIVFGPAYALLPSEEDHFRQSAGAQFEVCTNVRDKSVLLTTEPTSEHQTSSDGGNVEAINVCFLVKKNPVAPSNSTSQKAKRNHASNKAV